MHLSKRQRADLSRTQSNMKGSKKARALASSGRRLRFAGFAIGCGAVGLGKWRIALTVATMDLTIVHFTSEAWMKSEVERTEASH